MRPPDAGPPGEVAADVAAAVLALSSGVRYVALLVDGELVVRQGSPRADASMAESDYYEERLANPAMLDLARRRGAEGCGGFDFLVVGYGNFHQLLLPLPSGHASVALDRAANPLDIVAGVRAATSRVGGEGVDAHPSAVAPPSTTTLRRRPLFAWDDEPDAVGSRLVHALYAVSDGVRYVALNRRGRIVLSSRVADPAVGDRSDRYEELIVNPSLLTISKARGDIDCGGVRFLLVTYPTFFALVLPLADGHATVSLPRTSDPIARIDSFLEAVAAAGPS